MIHLKNAFIYETKKFLCTEIRNFEYFVVVFAFKFFLGHAVCTYIPGTKRAEKNKFYESICYFLYLVFRANKCRDLISIFSESRCIISMMTLSIDLNNSFGQYC